MSDPILLFLTLDAGALLLLGAIAAALPLAAGGFLVTTASGFGALLSLPSLLLSTEPTTLTLPVGPPGLSLHLALDPLAAFFLVTLLLGGTALAAFQASTTSAPAQIRQTAFSLAGAILSLLAADGVTLAIGLAILCAATVLPTRRNPSVLLTPFLLLAAICLLTPPGFAPRFDAIRAAPIDTSHATAAAALSFVAVALLTQSRAHTRCWTRDSLAAGVLIPAGCYLLLRVIADLAGAAPQTTPGFVLILAGGAIAIIQGWRAAAHPDIDGSVTCLARLHAGLAMTGIGIAMVARAQDLPGAESFALSATFLAAFTASTGGVLTALATHAIGASAGTHGLSRLGGLIQAMPATAAALSAGLLALSAIPPGLGFASLWLLFEALLAAPRTGGLLFQLPFAVADAALALSAALATAASVRLIGIALLGRPRTPQGAGARETAAPSRIILLALAGLSTLIGILPGVALWLLADAAIRQLAGVPPGSHIGLALLLPAVSSPNYLALPVAALLALATGAVMLLPRRSNKQSKPASLWADGMQPPIGLPFGEPAAQSAGDGFLPTLPDMSFLQRPIPVFPPPRPPSPATGLWLLLAASGTLLLCLAVFE